MSKKRLFFKDQEVSEETFANYSFAYSFKKRVASATKSLSVQRDNDDAITDVLFDGRNFVDLDSNVSTGGTLSDWIGLNNGFMYTDYDQKGNYDMTQTDRAKQAKVIANGLWLGYKDYNVGDCIYMSSIPCTDNVGAVYVKADKIDNEVLYYLSQAKAGDNKILSLSIQFDSPNNKLRLLDFTPSFNQIKGNNFLNVGVNKMMYQSDGSSYKMRLNGVNQTLSTVSGSHTGNWFLDRSDAGFTLQKGGLIWQSVSNYRNYKEYEILGFSVAHSDAESLAIENTM